MLVYCFIEYFNHSDYFIITNITFILTIGWKGLQTFDSKTYEILHAHLN